MNQPARISHSFNISLKEEYKAIGDVGSFEKKLEAPRYRIKANMLSREQQKRTEAAAADPALANLELSNPVSSVSCDSVQHHSSA